MLPLLPCRLLLIPVTKSFRSWAKRIEPLSSPLRERNRSSAAPGSRCPWTAAASGHRCLQPSCCPRPSLPPAQLLPVGIFPSWGLSQKLSCTVGPNRAREVSLTCMPVTAEMAERWGLVNHALDDNEVGTCNLLYSSWIFVFSSCWLILEARWHSIGITTTNRN
jgi:hypothetical protein